MDEASGSESNDGESADEDEEDGEAEGTAAEMDEGGDDQQYNDADGEWDADARGDQNGVGPSSHKVSLGGNKDSRQREVSPSKICAFMLYKLYAFSIVTCIPFGTLVGILGG